jgi:histidyl-tRNA synthetase
MSLNTQPYKGARDFYPSDMRLQKWLFSKWRNVVESFGYEEYNAPLIEPIELYTAKTSEEIVTEQSYVFEDRGGRTVTIRPEMTPSVSRMVAGRRQELAYPLRLYSIPNVWRYERAQRGRFREHWQLNVDLFGVAGIEADFEMIQISHALMQAVKAKDNMYTIKINSRKLINHILQNEWQLTETQAETLIRLIDRMHKIEQAEFASKLEAVLTPTQRETNLSSKIVDFLKVRKIADLPESVKNHETVKELTHLLDLCEKNAIKNVVFDVTLMRGFDYYTDIVFEVFDTDPENNRSMFGGGRYDGLVGMFGVEPVPTVGFGMGEATMINFLEAHNLMPRLRPETDVYVVLVGESYEKAQSVIKDLRGMGVNAAVDFSGKKLDKQIKSAAKKGVRYAMFIGEQELSDKRYKLKDLIEGKEESYSLERLVSVVKDQRHG